MIFLKKYMQIWYFLQMFWKDGLFKQTTLEYDFLCIIKKDDICFSQKHDFFIAENERYTIYGVENNR